DEILERRVADRQVLKLEGEPGVDAFLPEVVGGDADLPGQLLLVAAERAKPRPPNEEVGGEVSIRRDRSVSRSATPSAGDSGLQQHRQAGGEIFNPGRDVHGER